jgi:drug/metabolite transporter (DMT)-like permease
MNAAHIGEFAALGAAFLWACTSLLFTTTGRWVSPVATNLFKTVAATALFAAVLEVRHGVPFDPHLSAQQILLLGLSGILGLTLGDSLLYLGYQILGTRRAMLVQSLHPLMGAIAAWLILSERMNAQAWAGMVVAMAGAGIVVADRIGSLPLGERGRVRTGVLLSLGAAAGQASGALCAKAALVGADPFGATQVRVGVAALALVIFALLRGSAASWARGLAQPRVFWRLSIASVLGPFLAIWLMLVALQRAPTGVALTLLSMSPLWLLPLGALVQRDVPSLREIGGALLAAAGIALLLLR